MLESWSLIRIALIACASAGCASSAPRLTSAEIEVGDAHACDGIAERDRGPWDGSQIQAVTELREPRQMGKVATDVLCGAEIELRPTPLLTRAWLARASRCHVARHASALLPDRETDPLAVGQPTVSVRETDRGFVISVRGETEDEAKEILRRAQQLRTGR